jgi:DNA-binding PucR family transcriptional regulator
MHRKELGDRSTAHDPADHPSAAVRIASAPRSASQRPGPEQLDRLATRLADASQLATPVLSWLRSSGREASRCEALASDAGRAALRFHVAAASLEVALGRKEATWRRLDRTGPRRRLAELDDEEG